MSAPPKSLLDPGQIIQGAFDESIGSFRTTGGGSSAIIIDSVDDSITIGDKDGNYATVSGGALNVNATISSTTLPTNAAQESGGHLSSIDTKLSTINTTLGSPIQSGDSISVSNFPSSQAVTGTFFQSTQPISASILPLPTGASTSALQSIINTTLGTPFQAGGSIGNTTFASTQSGTWNISNVSGTVSLPTGASTSALQSTGNTSITSIDNKTPALGQALAAASIPVVLTSAQLSTLTPLSSVTANAGTNLNTSALALETGGNLASVNTKIPALGQALAAASVPIVLTVSQLTTLTPLSSVTVTQGAGTNLHTVIDSGTVTVNALPTGTNTIGAVEITDGTNGNAAIKAASTAATATDKALVVAVSPNNIISTQQTDISTTATLTAVSQAATLTGLGQGYTTWIADIRGTFSGGSTLVFEASVDGTNYIAINGTRRDVTTGGLIQAIGGPGPVSYSGNISGYQTVRVRCTVFTVADSIVITLRAARGDGGVFLIDSLPAGTNTIGTVTPPTITKGTQGSTGLTTQNLKDAGRNVTNYFMASQVISTATEALQSLTGYKGGVAVGATTTPAVVTSAKTYRINRICITYVAILTAGTIQINLRANLSGVATVTSPLVESWLVGAPSAVAGISNTTTIDIPDGMEFPAGTGLGLTVLGVGATGTAAIVGYAKVSMSGFEY